jgi:hypothetical protein
MGSGVAWSPSSLAAAAASQPPAVMCGCCRSRRLLPPTADAALLDASPAEGCSCRSSEPGKLLLASKLPRGAVLPPLLLPPLPPAAASLGLWHSVSSLGLVLIMMALEGSWRPAAPAQVGLRPPPLPPYDRCSLLVVGSSGEPMPSAGLPPALEKLKPPASSHDSPPRSLAPLCTTSPGPAEPGAERRCIEGVGTVGCVPLPGALVLCCTSDRCRGDNA